MNGPLRPLRIYVMGPLSANGIKTGGSVSETVRRNAAKADFVGRELFLKGHFPFIPHTMSMLWFEDERPEFHNYDLIVNRFDIGGWLSLCDAIYKLEGWEKSRGSMLELDWAQKHGLIEYDNLDQIPFVMDIAPDDYVKYLHHGRRVWTKAALRGKHRQYCLCYSCTRLNTEDRVKNCHIASDLFALCKKHCLTTPVFECPLFEEKQES